MSKRDFVGAVFLLLVGLMTLTIGLTMPTMIYHPDVSTNILVAYLLFGTVPTSIVGVYITSEMITAIEERCWVDRS